MYPAQDVDVGETEQGESHAWIEVWTGEWLALDPTAGNPVDGRYVLVARGHDYGDVPPVKGIFHGADRPPGRGSKPDTHRLSPGSD